MVLLTMPDLGVIGEAAVSMLKETNMIARLLSSMFVLCRTGIEVSGRQIMLVW